MYYFCNYSLHIIGLHSVKVYGIHVMVPHYYQISTTVPILPLGGASFSPFLHLCLLTGFVIQAKSLSLFSIVCWFTFLYLCISQMNEIICHLSLSDSQHILFNMILFNSKHIVANCMISCFLTTVRKYLHYLNTYIQQLPYSFICYWTSELVWYPIPHTALNIGVHRTFWIDIFVC